MSEPCKPCTCPLCAEMRARWEALKDQPQPPWDEAAEEQMTAAADSYDPETNWHRAKNHRKGRR